MQGGVCSKIYGSRGVSGHGEGEGMTGAGWGGGGRGVWRGGL